MPIPAEWFPGRPSFSLFPYPVVDETRRRPDCENSGDECSGHNVTDLTAYINLYFHSKAVRSQPPSLILQDYNKKNGNFSVGSRYPKPGKEMSSRCMQNKLSCGLNVSIKLRKTGEKVRKKPDFLAQGEKKKKLIDIISKPSKVVLLRRTSTGSVLFSLLYALTLPKLFPWVA